MKRWYLPATGLLVAVLACVMPGSVSQSDLDAVKGERDALGVQVSQMQTELDRLAGELQEKAGLQADLDDRTAELETLHSDLEQLRLDYEQISQAHQDVQAALESANTEMDKTTQAYVEISRMYELLMCDVDSLPDANFAKPDTFQQNLVDWILGWENKQRVFLDAETELPWDNSETRLISIRYDIPGEDRTIKQIFLAYFLDDLTGDGLYWVNQACWLYPPQ